MDSIAKPEKGSKKIEQLKLVIPGDPVPWSPARVTKKVSYSPREQEKNRARMLIRMQYMTAPIDLPVALFFQFHFLPPNSSSKKSKEKMLSGETFHVKKPDTSNLVKFAEDCLKGIVIVDDNQVVELVAKKCYSEIPKTIIIVETLGEYPCH